MSWCDAEQRVFLAGLVGVSSTDALSIKLVSDAALLLALRTLSIFCSTSGNSYQLNG